jgi:spermidine/putrescine transport system ATP-binding protein
VNLAVAEGEFFAILGPSGCGKTTLLRVIAGLETPDSGEILIHGAVATRLPAHERPIHTVFQSYALFPHLTVRENVGFALRMKRVAKPEIQRRVNEVMELTRIGELAERRPAQLSGGQKQRVALARALAGEPRVLLLDEPLAALDLQLRRDLRSEIRRVHRRTGVTCLLVTHDQEEALELADRIAVMRGGRVEQTGAGEELYERPRTRFVAEFLGACNIVEGEARALEDGAVIVDSPAGRLRVAVQGGAGPVPAPGEKVAVAIRPERVGLSPTAGEGPNEAEAVVIERIYGGADSQWRLRVGGVELRCRTRENGAIPPREGAKVGVRLPPEALRLVER